WCYTSALSRPPRRLLSKSGGIEWSRWGVLLWPWPASLAACTGNPRWGGRFISQCTNRRSIGEQTASAADKSPSGISSLWRAPPRSFLRCITAVFMFHTFSGSAAARAQLLLRGDRRRAHVLTITVREPQVHKSRKR